MGVTLRDVANYCGVSIATVSMIINGKAGRFTPETQEKVNTAIAKLGYTPNYAARSMATSTSTTIGLVITDVSDYFFSELAKGVGDVVSERGYDLLLASTGGKLQKEQEYVKVFRGRSVDGIIFAPINSCEDDDVFDDLYRKRYPFVTVERYLSNSRIPSIKMNNFQGGYDLTRLFLDYGHRRICFIAGPLCVDSSKLRFEGYIAALRSEDIALDDSLVYKGDFSYESGIAAGKRFLEQRPAGVTGVVASNNSMALGFLQVLKDAGYDMPSDISVAGIGGLRQYPIFEPKITTVDMPIYEMGRSAATMLFGLIDREKSVETSRVFDIPVFDQGSIRKLN